MFNNYLSNDDIDDHMNLQLTTMFRIFAHIMNSGFCHVFVTNTAFVIFQDIESNQEYKPKHNFIIIEWYNFC